MYTLTTLNTVEENVIICQNVYIILLNWKGRLQNSASQFSQPANDESNKHVSLFKSPPHRWGGYCCWFCFTNRETEDQEAESVATS